MDWNNFFQNVILKTNLFNFLILLGILIFCAIKFNLKEIIISTQEKIANTINEVKQNKLNSEKVLSEAKDAIKNLETDIKKINADAEQSIEAISSKIQEDADKQIKSIEKNTDKIILAEEKQLITGLIKEVSLISINKAKEDITKNLDNNIELQEKYINESIDKLDGLTI